MPKQPTKRQRWDEACSEARAGLETLKEMQDEYAEIHGNMNEGAQASAYGQKLEEMSNLDIDSALSLLDECEGVDLPQGFGRD